MRDGKKRNSFIIVGIICLLIGLTVGYAALSAQLSINGNTTIAAASWDIHFDSATEDVPTPRGHFVAAEYITQGVRVNPDDNRIVDFNVNLNLPKKYYEFTAVLTNHGSIPAKLVKAPTLTGLEGLTDKQRDCITITYSYDDVDRTAITPGLVLNKDDSRTVRVKVLYDDTKLNDDDDLPKENIELNLSLAFDFVQAD